MKYYSPLIFLLFITGTASANDLQKAEKICTEENSNKEYILSNIRELGWNEIHDMKLKEASDFVNDYLTFKSFIIWENQLGDAEIIDWDKVHNQSSLVSFEFEDMGNGVFLSPDKNTLLIIGIPSIWSFSLGGGCRILSTYSKYGEEIFDRVTPLESRKYHVDGWVDTHEETEPILLNQAIGRASRIRSEKFEAVLGREFKSKYIFWLLPTK